MWCNKLKYEGKNIKLFSPRGKRKKRKVDEVKVVVILI